MVSTTLNLMDRLLSVARNYQELGQWQAAARVLTQLAGFRCLSPETTEETHARLGEVQLRRGEYALARRYLRIALRHNPREARYHYLLGQIQETDETGDPRRAAWHYRQSLRLDPKQPRCMTQLGMLCLTLGRTDEGLRALRRAARLAPDDAEVVARLVEGLCLAERQDEARQVLQKAIFLNWRDARFRQLWDDFQYDELSREQDHADEEEDAGCPMRDEPEVVPFLRIAAVPRPRTSALSYRCDPAETPAPPHRLRLARIHDQKHAQ